VIVRRVIVRRVIVRRVIAGAVTGVLRGMTVGVRGTTGVAAAAGVTIGAATPRRR